MLCQCPVKDWDGMCHTDHQPCHWELFGCGWEDGAVVFQGSLLYSYLLGCCKSVMVLWGSQH